MTAIYIRIHDEIKHQIETGVFEVGQRLPSERVMAEQFGVSRMTLRQAVTSLVEEGILTRYVGSGTFVASDRVREKMRGTTSFTEIIQNLGKTPSSKVLSYQKTKANEVECDKLQLKKGAQIIRMERIRYADELPICYEVASIPYRLIEDFAKNDIANHFYETLANAGKKIGRSEQIISAKIVNKEIANFLSIKQSSAILALTQVSYFANSDETPFEYVLSQYVGERFEFYLER
ncbi:MAG: GntR family transcriptional regulator [Pseudolactococcus laudensis]|uniref:GntR family transcriptional regulator n=1 Tax=Pseudolactococcus laudensis TaxID=1494461 RepID=A0A7V8N1D4_9LACT|nr:GntR family transcriptional regulator [Lactococcus laudensis]MBA0016930.1 GntR family transcriptional regulator [Lactococcus laudensis]MBR2763700.1 GntR family transcriptional regulator [Lactococcus sp.]MBW9281591.1 GntR family transcriptional regulator [Lactococcus laudensis]CCK20574.1 Transcriptional regulator in cluster with beta-lactamase, GntR family [Lactococcus raffinolactis 4877]